MKRLLLVVLMFASASSFAATAFFTGKQEMVTTVTYQTGWNCQYSYAGQMIWRVFIGYCQPSIEVQ